MIICYWCLVSLHFVEGEGWVHQDGRRIRTEVGLDGKRRVHHWAQPVAESGLHDGLGGLEEAVLREIFGGVR